MFNLHTVFVGSRAALAGACLLSLVAYTCFALLEPWGRVATAQSTSDEFIVTQTINAEIAFVTTATDVVMSPAIGGITGGTANGQTQVAVRTNDPSGFTMTIEAENAPAMQGNTTAGTMSDYLSGTPGVPDYAFNTSTSSAVFAYTVSASTTAELAQKFKDNGSNTCGTGSTDTNGSTTCWYGLSTVATSTIVTTAATNGATSTIFFRVYVPANPSPNLPADTYTATTTLTATVN